MPEEQVMSFMPMNLAVLLPFRIFSHATRVLRIVAETPDGSFGLLPHRLDCVTALTPGILTYETEAEGEVYLAVDEGVLVKAGAEVLVSVRRATCGSDLDQLRASVVQEFLIVNARKNNLQRVMARMEAGFMRRFVSLQHDQ
jgi:F-type H+-transporting ATPase subunit epsilon